MTLLLLVLFVSANKGSGRDGGSDARFVVAIVCVLVTAETKHAEDNSNEEFREKNKEKTKATNKLAYLFALPLLLLLFFVIIVTTAILHTPTVPSRESKYLFTTPIYYFSASTAKAASCKQAMRGVTMRCKLQIS